jgi:hypothetical protein
MIIPREYVINKYEGRNNVDSTLSYLFATSEALNLFYVDYIATENVFYIRNITACIISVVYFWLCFANHTVSFNNTICMKSTCVGFCHKTSQTFFLSSL